MTPHAARIIVLVTSLIAFVSVCAAGWQGVRLLRTRDTFQRAVQQGCLPASTRQS